MKATLEFNLDTEKESYYHAVKGLDYHTALYKIAEYCAEIMVTKNPSVETLAVLEDLSSIYEEVME